jgi:hypothetical protein
MINVDLDRLSYAGQLFHMACIEVVNASAVGLRMFPRPQG